MAAAAAPPQARFSARVVGDFGRRFMIAPQAGGAPQAAVRRGKRDDVVIGDLVECIDAGGTATSTADPNAGGGLGSAASGDAVIEAVLPRNRLLFRSAATRTKLLAANVDLVAIVYAPQPTFDPRFIWRAQLAAAVADIGVLVVLNKIDLDDLRQAAHRLLAQLQAQGVATVAVSVRQAPQQARAALLAHCSGRATLLVGQSGMGKSSLLNLLVADARQRSQEFSVRLNLGRQTTSESRWFDLDEGGALIDAPGFHRFGLDHIEPRALAGLLNDFSAYVGHCRFADCNHANEPGCAVRAACSAGAIAPERYAFYRDLMQELGR